MRVLQETLPDPEYTQLELQATFFRGLGHPTCLKILGLLLEGQKNVGELVTLLGVRQGRISSHLACLRQCGYVTTVGRSWYTYYQVPDKQVSQLLKLAKEMIGDNAQHLWACTRNKGLAGLNRSSFVAEVRCLLINFFCHETDPQRWRARHAQEKGAGRSCPPFSLNLSFEDREYLDGNR